MDLVEQIEFLSSMFDGTVSLAIISSVLESCNGDVHLAADAIMHFSEEMCTLQSDEPPGEEREPPNKPEGSVKEDKPIEKNSNLNVEAAPFEFRPPITTRGIESLRENDITTSSLDKIAIAYGEPATTSQQSSITLPQEAIIKPSTSTTKPLPTTVNQQLIPSVNEQPSSFSGRTDVPFSTDALSMSFSQTLINSGAMHKKPPDLKPKASYTMKIWPDQISRILNYHKEGTRTLIIMRGASGSGKTHLAKHIVDYSVGASSQNYDRHIFSSDSYYMRSGVYEFNKNTLDQAHAMNKRKVCEATNNGVSPVVVDNTNTELWEMEPYIRDAVRNGYIIEFVEPNNAWSWNANQLVKRNIHGVSRDTIRRMLDRFDRRITPDTAMNALRLSYAPNRTPPQLRNIPPFSPLLSPRDSLKRNPDDGKKGFNALNRNTLQESPEPAGEHSKTTQNDEKKNKACDGHTPIEDYSNNDEHDIKLKKIIAAQKAIEQFEKVEEEWENGESWDSTTESNNVLQTTAFGPKSPRKPEQTNDNARKLIQSSEICDDWSKISMFMPPWENTQSTSSQPMTMVDTPSKKVMTSVGTGFEINDMTEFMYNILYGTPRNINENTPEKTKTKIPLVVMLDKSTSTHENDFSSIKQVCKNTESHFRELHRMFRSVPREILRDIFKSCHFDVNWAVNLVLDSYPQSPRDMDLPIDSESEEEDGTLVECNCLAGYNIIPDLTSSVENASVPQLELPPTTTPVLQKKSKYTKPSDNSMQLKRQIESNVMISDNHYSQHYLNLRRRRDVYSDRGEARPSTSTANTEGVFQASTSHDESDVVTNAKTPLLEFEQMQKLTQFSPTDYNLAGPSTSYFDKSQFVNEDLDSDTESESNKSDTIEKTVTINLGREFISKLDVLFGRSNFQYPDNVLPIISLPMSLLQQINAHWAMSVAYQLDEESRQSEKITKQDEEFARQLAAKEQEMSDEGKEPEIPTLKEIMDMEIAYALYERSISEWRNNEPQDMAAKLTREKLYNLFPDISKEVLSEMLMAHGYSFKDTIESLIISTGQANWLEDEKGIEKFVMKKEMERKEKFMEEQKKSLDETEWPYLATQEKPITLETVQFYRAEAEKSLQCRNQNFEKARQYFARNSPSAASFYSEIAALHTRRYEQSSCMAAAYLMNYHLRNNPDHDVLDLHYLRVSEAIVNLDIFLDQIIVRLRNKEIRYKETYIITGKGMHSVGGPRIKPATKRRLKIREIKMKQVNGGLFKATVYPTDKLTSEMDLEKS